MLFHAQKLDRNEEKVLDLVRDQWKALKFVLQSKPAAWSGRLRQSALARGIRGSNSIEGFTVSEDDAAAAVEGDAPYDTPVEAPSWQAVIGYREAMTHALRQGDDPDSVVDTSLIRSLHFMMLRYDPTKHPGSWRPGPIYVHDGRIGKNVYEGPSRERVPVLMRELAGMLQTKIRTRGGESLLVTAAMAHLNLAMIHPFSDGNGRMARCIQTLVLANARLFDSVFCSVEEWLGARGNTDEYYDVLASVGGPRWDPSGDVKPWMRFMLKAHYQQAGTSQRRQQETSGTWAEVETTLKRVGFSERAAAPLVEAAFGLSIRNSRYRYHAGVNQLTASRDLKALVDLGLLEPDGDGRGRVYRRSKTLLALRDKHRIRKDIPDPFTLV